MLSQPSQQIAELLAHCADQLDFFTSGQKALQEQHVQHNLLYMKDTVKPKFHY